MAKMARFRRPSLITWVAAARRWNIDGRKASAHFSDVPTRAPYGRKQGGGLFARKPTHGRRGEAVRPKKSPQQASADQFAEQSDPLMRLPFGTV